MIRAPGPCCSLTMRRFSLSWCISRPVRGGWGLPEDDEEYLSSLSLCASLPLSLPSAEVGGAPPVRHCAPRHRSPPHSTDCCCARSTCRRWRKKGKNSGGKEVDSDCLKTFERGEEGEGRGPDRREERTMASKETTAAGFANVSREITGELPTPRWLFFRGKCVFNAALKPLESARGGRRAGRARLVYFLLSRSLNNLFKLRLIWKELSPQGSAGYASPRQNHS